MQTNSFNQIVQNFATAVQGSAARLLDFSEGSVLLAIGQAMAGVVLWLQGMILTLLAVTRASTSNGPDLDSWFADFGFERLAAVATTGPETFSRFTPTAQALIPINTSIVQTADGTIQYSVVADATNPAFDATQSAYVLPAGQASVTVLIQCLTPGAIGNVSAGAISDLAVSLPGIDTVTNAAPLSNGFDAEQDSPARARFILYLASLSKATVAAIKAAIAAVKQGLLCEIIENKNFAGAAQPGMLTVVVDDGTGTPSSSIKDSVAAAVEVTRAAGITYGVFGPTLVMATVVMSITSSTATGAPLHSDVAAIVRTALLAYINSLPFATPLSYSFLATVAFNSSPYVTNVTAWTLNGGTADLNATGVQEIKAASVTVN
jgi:hypothetical protein